MGAVDANGRVSAVRVGEGDHRQIIRSERDAHVACERLRRISPLPLGRLARHRGDVADRRLSRRICDAEITRSYFVLPVDFYSYSYTAAPLSRERPLVAAPPSPSYAPHLIAPRRCVRFARSVCLRCNLYIYRAKIDDTRRTVYTTTTLSRYYYYYIVIVYNNALLR